MSVATLVLNAAYVALLGSTFTRTLGWLRVMLIVGSVAFVVFGAIEGIKSMIAWNIVIGGMHLIRLLRDVQAQRSVILSSELSLLRDELFPGLSDFDFNMLWCMGETVTHADEVVIAEGSIPECIWVVLGGTIAIEQSGEIMRGLRRGGLVGEMSFVSGQPADVNVHAQGTVVLRRWDQRDIGALDQVHPASARAFHRLIARDLAAKARV